MRHARANLRCTVFVSWYPGRAPLPFHPTNQPSTAHSAAPETKAFARTILQAGDRPTARPWCSMLSEQPQHRTTSLPPQPGTRRMAPAPAAWPQWANSASADRQLRTPWLSFGFHLAISRSMEVAPIIWTNGSPRSDDQLSLAKRLRPGPMVPRRDLGYARLL
jgi:hypothetical protein